MNFVQWLRQMFASQTRVTRSDRRDKRRQPSHLRFVPNVGMLEQRLAPAILTVTSTLDGTLASLQGNDTLDLREAIELATVQNTYVDGYINFDTNNIIRFASSLDGQTINLSEIGNGTAGPSAFGFGTSATLLIDGQTGLSHGITLARDSTAPLFRLFYVGLGSSLTLDSLTIRDFKAQGGAGGTGVGAGGGGAAGMGGVALVNQGSLTVRNSTLTANTAQGGAGGSRTGDEGPGNGGGGLGGAGGGRTAFNDNVGGTGGGPSGGAGGEPGDDGATGGLFSGGGGGGKNQIIVSITGVGGMGGFGGGGGGGGSDGSGLIVREYEGAFGGDGGFGGGGGGAGRGALGSDVNGTGGYGAGDGGPDGGGGGGGGAGMGGAIFNTFGSVIIINSTLTGNTAIGGAFGTGTGGNGTAGEGLGGAVFSRSGNLTVTNSTISTNVAADGGRGILVVGDSATARAIFDNTIIGQSDTSVSDLVLDTIGTGDVNLSGTDAGTNLIRTTTVSGVATTAFGFLTDDPQLGSLQNNGGRTPTMAIPNGSPAIDRGTAGGAPSTDQRGFSRIDTADIGAFEFGHLYVGCTDGDDTLIITATSANSGSYTFNGGAAVAFSNIASVIFDGCDGNDLLRVINPAGGLFAPRLGIDYDGGPENGANGDRLEILGGAHTTETHTFLPNIGGNRGTITLVNGGVTVVYSYNELEPILINAGTPNDVIFNLPTGDGNNNAVLGDNGFADGLSRISGTGFETTTFVNPANTLTVNLGNDGETFTLAPLDPAFVATAINLNGGTVSDTINILATPASTITTLNIGGAAPDTINVSSTGATLNGNLNGIDGQLRINNGPSGSNSVLNISESGLGVADVVTVDTDGTGGTITGTAGGGWTIALTRTTPLTNGINLFLGSAGDTINVRSTNVGEAIRVDGNAGADTLTVGSLTNSLDSILSGLTFNAGGQAGDTLNVNDQGDTTVNAYTITSTQVTRASGGVSMAYSGLAVLNLNAGTLGDTISVNGTAVGAVTNINGTAGDDVISMGNGVTLNGGIIDGGSGTDRIDYTGSTAPVAVNLGLGVTGLTGTLEANQEVPPTSSTASGTVSITNYNPLTKTYDIVVTVDGLTPAEVTGFHIHRGAFGTNGPIIVDLGIAGFVVTPTGFTFTAIGLSLDPLHEAAFLGGLMYVNLHTLTSPSGEIRGQIFSTGNVAVASGTATGTGGVLNIENATGGSGTLNIGAFAFGDSLIGTTTVNVLQGGIGNDVLIGGPGNDTLDGGADNDILVWSNGDNSDVMDGGIGNDLVYVNGNVAAGDIFAIGAGVGGRVNFQRTNLVPFALDIGTVESLTVNGIGGDDTFAVNSLTGVTNLSSIRLDGLDGNDSFNVIPAVNTAIVVQGGAHTIADTLTVDAGGNFSAFGPNSVTVNGQQSITHTFVESVIVNNLTGSAVVTGSPGDDILTLFRTGNDLQYIMSSASTATITLTGAAIASGFVFGFNGAAGSDQLIVDYTASTGGAPIPEGGILFVGGESDGDDDRLTVTGFNVGTVTVTHTGPESGSVQIGVGSPLIQFSQLEPVTLTGTMADLIITLTASADPNVVLSDDGTASDANGNTANTSSIDGPSIEFTEFTNPTNSLTINAQGGDLVQIAALDALFATPFLTLTGGGLADIFRLIASNVLPDVVTLLMNNATFDVSTQAEVIGSLAGTGALTFGTNGTLTTGGNGTSTTYSGSLSGPTSSTLFKQGGGTFSLTGTSPSFDGSIQVDVGTLRVTQTTGLGSTVGSTTVDNAATLTLDNVNYVDPESLTLVGGTLNTIGSSTFEGLIILGATSTVETAAVNDTLVLNGFIAATAPEYGLIKTGAGRVVLAGSGNYTGQTSLTAGILDVPSIISSQVAITAGTLNGSGTVGGIIANGGIVDPGATGSITPTVLSSSASVTLNVASTFAVLLGTGTFPGNSDSDRLAVTGAVTLNNPTLTLTDPPTALSFGARYLLIDNDGIDRVVGTFAGLPEGAFVTVGGVKLQISYVGGTGNDVVLTASPELSITDVTVTEGDAGTTRMVFTLTLSGPSFQVISVDFETDDETATTADGDYTARTDTLIFLPGQTTRTITINVTGDLGFEPTEALFLNLSTPINVYPLRSRAHGTITNDDPQPTASITDVTANEGNAGVTSYTFTVSLSNPASRAITIDYSTADGTATAVDGDFTAVSGMLTFAPGETTKTITVNVTGDGKFEPTETFTLNLTASTGPVSLTDAQGLGTVTNDDTQPTVSISSAIVNEGAVGQRPLVFTLTLSNSTSQSVTVEYVTVDKTATAGVDYVATTGSITFAPGETSKTISVEVNGDNTFEEDERLVVNLTGVTNSTIAIGEGVGTIRNDDTIPSVSVAATSAVEGHGGTQAMIFTLTLSNPSDTPVTVSYSTGGGTATAGLDYATASGIVTFAPGQTTQTVTVNVDGDGTPEPDETLLLTLANPIGAVTGTAQATGTIINDDAPARIAIGTGFGVSPSVLVYDPTTPQHYSPTPQVFPREFTGGVRTSAADVNGDGVADIIAGAGPGGGSTVVVLDGKTFAEIRRFAAYETEFNGGVFVAGADLNDDGFAEIVTTPDEGGGARVRVFDGKTGAVLADFFGIEDPAFRGGARVALADLNGDQTPDLIIGAGFGGGPRLAAFDGRSLRPGELPQKLFADFFVFEQTLRNGVYVAGGDVNGDGFAELIVGGGPGGGPRVFALSGRELVTSFGANQVEAANFFAGDPNHRGGVEVAVRDLDLDGRAEIVTGDGEGDGVRIHIYRGDTVRSDGLPGVFEEFDAFPGFTSGVFVG